MTARYSRRAFLELSALGGIAAALPTRRAAGAPRPELQEMDLEEATVADLQSWMRDGAATSAAICAAYLERIEAVDRTGPTLRSVIETNPDALRIAEARDAERAAGRIRGPLHGVPVLIKDNLATADRMSTTAGSLALDGVIAPRDAFVVGRLRAAGAVILAKTNLSEWANFRSTQSSSGWSGRGGQCRNPYALDRNPCGSSSGTGAAISANLGAVGIGTETDGSIVCPSHANGLVGIKPTVGLVSRTGIIPISHTQDTAGPMCRSVTDAAIVLAAIAAPDPADTASTVQDRPAPDDYTRYLDADGLRGARIGVARERFWGYSPETDRICEEAVAALREAGAIVVDPADIPNAGRYNGAEFDVLLYEFKDGINRYLAEWAPGASVRTLADLIAFNERERVHEMPYFGQEIFTMAEAKGPLTDAAYREALETCARLSRAEGLDAVMDEHRLDALVAPTGSPAWLTDLVNGDHYMGASSTPGAVSGYPHVTVPAGFSFGLPVGITFIGRQWAERTLVRLAYGFEQATRVRAAPRLLPSADLAGA